MMIVMRPTATEEQVEAVIAHIEAVGARAHLSRGEEVTVIGAIGDRDAQQRPAQEPNQGRAACERHPRGHRRQNAVGRMFLSDPGMLWYNWRRTNDGRPSTALPQRPLRVLRPSLRVRLLLPHLAI